ncbi:hypothetical protein HDU92_002508 [Lobulomyces angularis]|nr:hypothetical protein HDU92_002508 [Lobulomyces angularis]
MTEDDFFHQNADKTLESIQDNLDALDENYDIEGFDLLFSSGVLTVKFGVKGTYVLNKQPPNKQIWLSSPVSGPRRFNFNTKNNNWISSREEDNQLVLETHLSNEISKLLGVEDLKI